MSPGGSLQSTSASQAASRNVAALLREALAEHQSGHTAQAERRYRQVLSEDPQNPDALHLLGMLIAPKDAQAAFGLVERAIALRPATAIFHNSLGTVSASRGDYHRAIQAFTQAIQLSPKYAAAHANLGTALAQANRLDDAEAQQRQALACDPNYAEAWSHLGDTLRRQGRFQEAIAAQQKAIALQPNLAVAHNNLGALLRETGEFDQAFAEFERAVQLQPTYAPAHYNFALALLLKGDYQRGWEEYRWRWGIPEFQQRKRNFSQPPWDGQQIHGKTVLLHAEQGFGDTLQMVRFVPLVARRGASVILECQPELKALFSRIDGVRQVIEPGATLPHFDFHASLMDLPMILGTRLDSIPSAVPYLTLDPAAVAEWRTLLPPQQQRIRAGIAWTGNIFPDPQRICPADALRAVAELDGIQLICVQKQPPTQQEQQTLRLFIPPRPLNNFHDSAALIANLDCIISIDTAVAHLAGALGKPTWTLLPFSADWRWLPNRGDSPWYPTMRLIRQRQRGDWTGAISELCAALKAHQECTP